MTEFVLVVVSFQLRSFKLKEKKIIFLSFILKFIHSANLCVTSVNRASEKIETQLAVPHIKNKEEEISKT